MHYTYEHEKRQWKMIRRAAAFISALQQNYAEGCEFALESRLVREHCVFYFFAFKLNLRF